MSKATHADARWAVLAHPTGEVLTAEARSPGLHLGLLGVPPGFDRRDAEGWLYDVGGVAHDSGVARPASRPIPALLDHAMTGLLFSHGEIWDQPDLPSPCSFAFVEGRGEVGFGWVGDARVSVWVDGQARTPAWVMVRDDRGRQARAWSIPSHHDVQVRISWSRSPYGSPYDPSAGGAEVEAAWNSEGGPEVAQAVPLPAPPIVMAHPPAHEAPEAPAPAMRPDAEEVAAGAETPAAEAVDTSHDWVAEYEAEVRRSSPGFMGRIRNAIAWLLGRHPGRSEPTTAADRAKSDMSGEPAASEPALDDAAAATATDGRTPAAAGDLIPPTPETAVPAPESDAPAPFVSGREGYTVLIPPTPEPAELTTRALGWNEADDPNAIELPALEPPPPVVAAPSPPPAPPPPAPAPVELEITDVLLDEPLPITGLGRPSRPLEGLQRLAEAPVAPVAFTPPEPAETYPPATEEAFEEAEPVPVASPEADRAASDAGVVARLRAAAGLMEATEATRAPEPMEGGEVTGPPEAIDEGGATPPPFVMAPPQHPAWPSPQELARPRWMPGKRHGLWIALVGALFAGGWLLGAIQDDGRPRDAGRRGALGQALSAIGLGGPRYLVQVNSRPPGAWISVDGQSFTLRTPAAIEVAPGDHSIGLSFTEFGNASFKVRGRKGDRVPLDATLWGALDVVSPSEIGLISVSVDGVARGLAPLRVDSLNPGVHEVRFSGLNIPSWGQTVDIRVGETREILARAVQSPASGVLQVEATLTDAMGTQPLKGAQVWIDGELRGITPLTLDLPRGPHSVRLVYKGQEAPIQVIELPGGNQRFAVFELGLDLEVPRLAVDIPARIPRDRPAVLSATLIGLAPSEVREMWLHVRMAEGAWRRYGMTVLKSPTGTAGVATFPTAAFDEQGRARYYVSAHSGQGDEIVTEIKTVTLEAPAR